MFNKETVAVMVTCNLGLGCTWSRRKRYIFRLLMKIKNKHTGRQGMNNQTRNRQKTQEETESGKNEQDNPGLNWRKFNTGSLITGTETKL